MIEVDGVRGRLPEAGDTMMAGDAPPQRDIPAGIELIRIERQAGCALLDRVPAALPDAGFLWIDVHAGSGRHWVDIVRRVTGVEIFEEHLIDSENTAHPSFFDSTAHYEMIVVRALLQNAVSVPPARLRIATRPAVLFVLPRCLVTIRPADSPLMPHVRERLLAAERFHQRVPAQPEELMLRLLSGMVDRYLELRQPLTLQLEDWQRNLLNPKRPFKDWPKLLEARMEVRKLQNLCEEQLDAVREWRDERNEHDGSDDVSALAPISDGLNVRVTDLIEHIQRVLNHARSLESAIESAVQLHFSATAFRTTEIMRVLTVLTAIFMPLTLITGIFGMNFEFIPGIHSQRGFWVTIGAMGLLGLAMFSFFVVQRYLEAPLPERTVRRVTDRYRKKHPVEESTTMIDGTR